MQYLGAESAKIYPQYLTHLKNCIHQSLSKNPQLQYCSSKFHLLPDKKSFIQQKKLLQSSFGHNSILERIVEKCDSAAQ